MVYKLLKKPVNLVVSAVFIIPGAYLGYKTSDFLYKGYKVINNVSDLLISRLDGYKYSLNKNEREKLEKIIDDYYKGCPTLS